MADMKHTTLDLTASFLQITALWVTLKCQKRKCVEGTTHDDDNVDRLLNSKIYIVHSEVGVMVMVRGWSYLYYTMFSHGLVLQLTL